MTTNNHAMEIEFNIDKILLHGFRHIDKTSLSQALNQELNSLLKQPGGNLKLNLNNTPHLNIGQLSLTGMETSEHLGVKIAQTLFNNVNTGQSSLRSSSVMTAIENGGETK